jgi:hypothetical protein
MLDVHPPHESAHTWRSFFIHIATIVIGLIIAVGLEQIVEYIHHRHQRAQLEEQMHDVFGFDQSVLVRAIDNQATFRDYLAELRAAIVAIRAGKKGVAQPPADDPRMRLFGGAPSFAPYEAAKENGTIAQLPAEEIRLFNRIVFQRELYDIERDHWLWSLVDLSAFHERFVDSPGLMQFNQIVTAPDLASLSPAELTEYLALVATVIKKTDALISREKLVYVIVTAVLEGVHSEEELIDVIRQKSSSALEVPLPPAVPK